MPINNKIKLTCQARLFDWGDTLMVDFKNQQGIMRDWPEVAAVKEAKQALHYLSQQAPIYIASGYIASGAAQSSPNDIQKAFERVELAH